MDRQILSRKITAALRRSPIVALLGPRQCGKTTIARQLAEASESIYFDLEDPLHLARLEQPISALDSLRGLIVIDEVQRRPDLFPVLRVLADRARKNTRFLILGSASPELIRQGSETLAGRIAFVEMAGFDLKEVGPDALERLWVRGGLPRSYLARSLQDSLEWREDFVRTFLERDIRMLGINVPASSLRRLWMMLAHYHGQVLNVSEIARSLGEGHTTVRRHIDLLSGTLVTRQVQPWFENLGKRQVKAPKIYVRDSGLLHALLGIRDMSSLGNHPKLGASWEGFVIEQIVGQVGERSAFFWATQSGAELDLVLMLGTRRIGIEVKYADAPRTTKSMAIAIEDLRLDALYVVYPGSQRYRLNERTEALPCAVALEVIGKESTSRRGAKPPA